MAGLKLSLVQALSLQLSDSVTSTFISSSGKIKTKSGFGYNAKLKGKLVGVWATNILRKGGLDKATGEYKSIYAKRYYDSRIRYENRSDLVHQLNQYNQHTDGVKKPNFHIMARRVAVQQLLEDFWFATRAIDGLPTNGGTYAEDKLGRMHLQERPHILPVQTCKENAYGNPGHRGQSGRIRRP